MNSINDDDDIEDAVTLPDALTAWIASIIREELQAFLHELWEDGDLQDIVRDAIREGTAEAIEDVAAKQPWRQMLGPGGEKRKL